MTYHRHRERTPDEIAADQAFLAKARSRSPVFPNINEVLERRQKAREAIAARVLLGVGLGGIAALIAGQSFGWVGVGLGFGGFIVTCFVAGNREFKRSTQGGGSYGRRPF